MNRADYRMIVDKLMVPHIDEICNAAPELKFVRENIRSVYIKYNEIEADCIEFMQDKVLDRHKVCACICLAICDARLFDYPLMSDDMVDDFNIRANEIFALQVALDLLYSFFAKVGDMRPFMSKQLLFPRLITDDKPHFDNTVSGLLFSNRRGSLPDYWWLAQIFYYIEIFNVGLGRGRR